MATLERAEEALLAGVPLFRGAGAGLARRAAEDRRCARVEAARGEVIYAPHAFRRSLGVLLSGRVQVSKGELLVSGLGAGDLFGAAALFNDRTDYAATLTARTACTALLFPQEQVEELLEAHPVLAENYIRYLSGRVRFLERKLGSLTAGGAEGRLAGYLLERREGDAVELDCPATALAARLNLSRASLYRAMDGLTAAGAIERRGKRIRILDENRLHTV